MKTFRQYATPTLDVNGRYIYLHSTAQLPLVGKGLLITEALRSHSNTSQSVGLLCTSDQPDASTSTWQHTTLTRDRRPCPGGIQTRALHHAVTGAAHRYIPKEILVSGANE
jgi:hypothetical protein